MNEKKLIVNADDFGLTDGINRAILEGHRNGIITSATLMANGAAFRSAVEMSLANPTLGVGIHLNLTEGAPVADPSDVPSLVRPEGQFLGSPGRLAKSILTGKVKPKEIECELRRQVEKIAAAGVRITHLDSHKHIHVLPPVFDATIRVALAFGISSVRCPAEPAASGLALFSVNGGRWRKVAKQYAVGRALSGLAAWQRQKLAQAGLHCAESFCGLSHTGFLNGESLKRILRTLPRGTTELICHPGYVDEALLRTRTRLRAERETELHALTCPEIRQLVTGQGIELINYGDLTASEHPACNPVDKPGGIRPVQQIARKG